MLLHSSFDQLYGRGRDSIILARVYLRQVLDYAISSVNQPLVGEGSSNNETDYSNWVKFACSVHVGCYRCIIVGYCVIYTHA